MKHIEIIAEVGINHGGDIKKAYRLIDAAYLAGADTVKFQTVNADITYKKEDPFYQIYKETEFAMPEWISLRNYILFDKRMNFLSTPGDMDSVNLLSSIGMERFKVASDKAEDVEFVNYIMSRRREVIVSMGKLNKFIEVKRLVERYKELPQLIFHCVSKYPTPAREANFQLLRELVHGGYPVGYSDHVVGIESAIVAVSLGAQAIEKHLKLDDNCVDAPVSLNPIQFNEMVRAIRNVEQML